MSQKIKSQPVLMIDNYDSFTYNLVHYLQKLQQNVLVRRNDELSLQDIEALKPSHIVISPGPGRPENAGISLDIIRQFQGEIPILGVCLGHQAVGQAFGGRVVKAKRVMHGKTSRIFHLDCGIFKGLPQGFAATRYHSLVLDETSLPECLQVTAWTKNAAGERQYVMGIRHKALPLEGVQFHPESVLSEQGLKLLKQFLQR